MRTHSAIHVISCHAEGEVGDVIVGGVLPPPGDSLWKQSRYIASDNRLRNFMLNEPRGGVFRHVNLLVPPHNQEADAAFIIMEPADTPPMSGSNSLCVATVLLETGMVPMQEPVTTLTLEAPGGLIKATAQCSDGKVQKVTIHNVPSFVSQLNATLEVEGFGTVTVDTAYGGDSFVIVSSESCQFSLNAHEARDIAELGTRITAAANEQLTFSHPTNDDWTHFSFCQFAAPVEIINGIKTGRNAVAIRPGKIDRSPTGTGCSARMAVLHARGELAVDEPFAGISIIDSRFDCRITGTTQITGQHTSIDAIHPSIAGRAFVTGMHQHFCDPDDPWPEGYRLSDTWPGA